jgi:hypothetical protein
VAVPRKGKDPPLKTKGGAPEKAKTKAKADPSSLPLVVMTALIAVKARGCGSRKGTGKRKSRSRVAFAPKKSRVGTKTY